MSKPACKHSAYHSYWAMIRRCYDKKFESYKHYGARGITVCQEWRNSKEKFYEDMGPRPKGMSLDRIDNSKGYSKENCKWSTRSEQMNNTRDNFIVTIYGMKMTATQAVQRYAINGISPTAFIRRINSGWSSSRALVEPVRQYAGKRRQQKLR